ncbi:MAG: hypothetical protein ACXV3D_05215 [Halobacteriota archaeon]
MKLKLIAVAMMALLVLTIVPMVGTAAKPTSVTYDVHSWNSNTHEIGPVVGSVTIADKAHSCTYAWTSTLTPGVAYDLNAVSISGLPIPKSGTLDSATANAHGSVNAHGTVSSQAFDLIQLRQAANDLVFLAVPINV